MKSKSFLNTETQRHREKQKRGRVKKFRRYSVAPLFCVSSMLLTLSGCTMAPSYTRPEAPVPASWPTGPAYKAEAAKPDQKPVADIPWRDFLLSPACKR